MSPKDSFKNRLPISEMKEQIVSFLEEQNSIYLSLKNDTDFPTLEIAEYRFYNGKHLVVLPPISIFINTLETGSKITGFVYDKNGRGLKMTKRVYGDYVCEELNTDNEMLVELSKTDDFVKKMLTHNAKFFVLEAEKSLAYFGSNEIYTLDNEMNPSFSEFTITGKKRYENSRHVLMTYLDDREVIFNVIVENGVYYSLTKANSRKVEHIKNGGVVKIFDGRDNHFETKINILDESLTAEVFEKLMSTNNGHFKTNENLLAISFSK